MRSGSGIETGSIDVSISWFVINVWEGKSIVSGISPGCSIWKPKGDVGREGVPVPNSHGKEGDETE